MLILTVGSQIVRTYIHFIKFSFFLSKKASMYNNFLPCPSINLLQPTIISICGEIQSPSVGKFTESSCFIEKLKVLSHAFRARGPCNVIL